MNKKLKITFLLFQPTLGGGDRVVSIYARYLKQQGHTVTVAGLAWPRPPILHAIKKILRNRRKAPSPTHHYDNAGIDVSLAKGTDALTDDYVPDSDIVIATYWLTAEWVANLGPSKGAKAYFVQNYEALFPGVDVERVKATYHAPLKKIVISKWLDRLMRTEFNNPPAALIDNSVDEKQFFAQPRNKNEIPTIGFLYHNSHIKGIDVSLKAIERIQNKIPKLKIISFGASPPNSLLPLPQNCEFHYEPPQDKIRELYAQCDLWLCGSRMEGFHLPPMEAMACRCPVVSTAVGGPEDVIENGKQGYVVPVEDSNALADKAIKVLQTSDEEWRQMSNAAYETATGYTWNDAGALFEAALHKIVDENRDQA